jgi:UDP-N-acetylglucosamine 2-epimerase (non-hydrolysing)
MRRLLFVFGTRPEAIKLAPVILAARRRPEFSVRVCVTAQHRQMLDQVLTLFGIVPDSDLDLMRPGQTLAALTARIVEAVDAELASTSADVVIVQGDTTTTMAAALAAFYRRVPVAHVEAGLRTGQRDSPFPEEVNRTITSRLADRHFAPTTSARANLLLEGIPTKVIEVTGNTVIDALLWVRERVRENPPELPPPGAHLLSAMRPLVLVTGHRRESFGGGLEAICQALGRLADTFPDTDFVYPVHLNPSVQEPVHRLLGGRANVFLLPPLGYAPFVALLDRSTLVMTDSGGIQEEAPSLGKPVLVMRETTERPEAVAAGTARLVGTDAGRIVAEAAALLRDPAARLAMVATVNPFGDGCASDRILDALSEAQWPAS